MATPNSTVVVAAGAIVTATATSAVTIDVPVVDYGSNYETVSVAGRLQGIGIAGITLNNGSVASSGYYYGQTTALMLNVATGGVVSGTNALVLGQSSGNTTGLAIATIDNAGTLTGISGIALQVTNPSLGGFASITNRSGGTIGAISGSVGSLANAGTIDGSAQSAIDAGASYNFYVPTGIWTNTGTITSAATTATLRNVSVPLVNSGTISNTGSGADVQGTSLTVTNQAGGLISAPGGTAIAASGKLSLVNAGTIDGDVTVSPSAASYYPATSTIDSTTGTINGNVTLSSGNDVLVARYVGTPALVTGITGTIDGGGGTDSVEIATARDTVIDTTLILPTGFQQLQLAPAVGTTVTLADGFVAPGTITLVGAGAFDGGSVVNDAGLTFAGQAFTSQDYNAPVSFANAGSISVTGGTIGTPALNLSGISTFINTGSINVIGTGVSTSVNGTTANSGTITATGTALTAFDNVVTNSGTIQSTMGIGLALSGSGGTPAYNSGVIEGATVGVSTSIDLTNTGTILATNAGGTAVALDAYGSLINEAGGIVGNGGLAVTASIFNSTVANAGTINGDVVLSNVYSGSGERYLSLPGGVLNGNLSLGNGDLLVTELGNTGPGAFAGITGTVSAAAGALLRYQVSNDASATLGPVGPFQIASYQLVNNATLNLTAPAEITQTLQLAGAGTVNLDASISTSSAPAILSTSTILAPGQTGAANQLAIISAGTITVTRAADSYPVGAVYLGSNDSFTNNGMIRVVDAQDYSPTAGVFGGAVVTNNGAIQLDGGIGVNESAALVNTGAITQVAGGTVAQGVLDVVALDNSGTISVEGAAVANSPYSYGPMRIVNRATGLIATAGSQTIAISSNGALSLDNAGTIAAPSGSIAIQATGYVGNNILNTGTIDGDIFLGSGNNIVENQGTIDGRLTFGAGDDQLTLLPGSKITGIVDGGDGNDQVTLAGLGSGSFAGAVNFERLDVASGNWTLTGASGFADGTFIERGASLTGSVDRFSGAIVDNGTLIVRSGATSAGSTFGAVTITGTGAVSFTGAGTVILDGTDSITSTGGIGVDGGSTLLVTGKQGGTVVVGTAGTVTVGNGGTTGALTGSVVDDGTLVLNRSDDAVFTAGLSGTGALVKQGTGEVTLSGSYAFTGTTTIVAGALKLPTPIASSSKLDLEGAGELDLSGTQQRVAELSGASKTASINIAGGALTVDQASTTSFAGSIVGAGSLTKTGSGSLNLTGVSTYAGPTTINGGRLAVNGSITSPVSVNAGGILGGNGSVGSVTIGSGGTYAPGNSIGAQTVNGNVTFAPGAIYEVQTDAAGNADRINATGTATLNGGTVEVLAAAGTYARQTNYTILTAAGGVTGKFATVTSNMAFLSPLLTYGADTVSLTLARNDLAFGAIATNQRELAVANAVAARGVGDTIYNTVLFEGSGDAQRTFSQLSGEIHASLPSELADAGRRVRGAILDHLTPDEGLGIWGQGLQSYAASRPQAGLDRIQSNRTGGLGGVDYAQNGITLGLNAGYLDDEVRISAAASHAHVKMSFLGATAGIVRDGVFLRVGGTFAWQQVDTSRVITAPGLATTLYASPRANSAELFGEAGYDLTSGPVKLTPFLGNAYNWTRIRAFTETGGIAALHVDRNSRNTDFLSAGVRLTGSTPVSGKVVLLPRVMVSYQHGFGDLNGSSVAELGGTGPSFAITGVRLGRNSLNTETGFDLQIGSRLTVGGSGFASTSREWSDYGAKASIGFRF